MKLYCIPNCDECENVKKFIQTMGMSQIEIVELELVDDKYMDKTTYRSREVQYEAFPVLESREKSGSFELDGEPRIKEYLTKGFLHEVKMCPITQKDCVESKCEWFYVHKGVYAPYGDCEINWISSFTERIRH